MKKVNLISSIVLMGLAIATLLEASKLPFGTLRTPKAGFFPFVLAIFLAVFSLILLGQTIKEKNEGGNLFGLSSGNWKKIGLAAGSLFAFAFVVEYLGYILSTFLLIAFLLRAIEPQKWWVVIALALLSSLVTYVVFSLLLSTPLPEGVLGI